GRGYRPRASATATRSSTTTTPTSTTAWMSACRFSTGRASPSDRRPTPRALATHRKDVDAAEQRVARGHDPEQAGDGSLKDPDPIRTDEPDDRKPGETGGERPGHPARALAREV